MNYHDAKVQARALSIDNQCGQHVNRRLDMSYYTSDWYSADSTVVTYDRGRVLFVSGDAITTIEEGISLVLDSHSECVEIDVSDIYACKCGCEDDAETHTLLLRNGMHLVQ